MPASASIKTTRSSLRLRRLIMRMSPRLVEKTLMKGLPASAALATSKAGMATPVKTPRTTASATPSPSSAKSKLTPNWSTPQAQALLAAEV